MLRLLHSLFARGEKGISDAIVKEAIERAVDGTDPWLRAVSGYKRKLRPAVQRALEHVTALAEALPPPFPVTLESYDDPRLKPFFISNTEMKEVFAKDRSLKEFLAEGRASGVCALLAMEKQEKATFGAEVTGTIVLRDVPQVAVTFENHRLVDPSGEEGETRRLLKRRAYDHLLGLALKRLGGIKGERAGLERRRALLNAKLNLLQQGGFGFDKGDSSGKEALAEIEERLGQIETELGALGGEDRVLDTLLDVVVEVLGHPEKYLWGTRETIFIDPMGIKRDPGEVPALPVAEVRNTEGRNLVVLLVSLRGEDFCRSGN